MRKPRTTWWTTHRDKTRQGLCKSCVMKKCALEKGLMEGEFVGDCEYYSIPVIIETEN